MRNVLVVVLLLFCMAIAWFWWRSDNIGDHVRWYSSPRMFEMHSNDGLLLIAYGTLSSQKYPPPPGWDISFWPFNRGNYRGSKADLRNGTKFGFRYERWKVNKPGLTGDACNITFPYWLPMLVFVVSAVIAVRWRRRIRGGDSGSGAVNCVCCGYNLRATPDRCPECGTISSDPR